MLMRDAFINEIYLQAQKKNNLIFLSADFGAAALDSFRENLPGQFIHMGISEQNMVDVGAGLAISGKFPILYAMAPFLLHRAYEQIKSVVSAMNLPVTFVSVGCGLGYDHATFTHFTPEDVAIAKAINGMEVWTASDASSAKRLAQKIIKDPALRYIRLERNFMPDLISENGLEHDNNSIQLMDNGYREFGPSTAQLGLISTGYLTHKLLEAQSILSKEVVVFDLLRIKPLSKEFLSRISSLKKIIVVEEQLLEGGIGSGIIEALSDLGFINKLEIVRIGLHDGFDVFNGNRDYLHEAYGMSVKDVTREVMR